MCFLSLPLTLDLSRVTEAPAASLTFSERVGDGERRDGREQQGGGAVRRELANLHGGIPVGFEGRRLTSTSPWGFRPCTAR